MSQSPISRRQLLKFLTAAAGTAVLSSVPNKWKTPVVEVGMLPAHAQSLSGVGAVAGTITLSVPGASVGKPAISATSTATITATNVSTLAAYKTTIDNPSFPLPYTISNVPAGTYNVECVLTGIPCLTSNSQTDNNIVVPSGGNGTANFSFQEQPC